MTRIYLPRFFTLILIAVLFLPQFTRADSLLLEAESFDKTGGWLLDQQFTDQMGSPYLLAHGLGKPVDDASAMANFPSPGTYLISYFIF